MTDAAAAWDEDKGSSLLRPALQLVHAVLLEPNGGAGLCL